MAIRNYFFLLVTLGYLVFFNSLFNGFVYDDIFQIVNNQYVHSGDFLYYFFHTTGENPHYRPLMFMVFTFIFQLFGLHAFFFHFFQVSIHIINGLLVFLLFQRFSKQVLFSFLLALLFIVHPLNAEPVVYISNLQDVLFVFFGLGVLYVGINQPVRYSQVITTLFLFLSLLAKETGVLFVIIYSIYLLIFSKRDLRQLQLLILAWVSVLSYLLIRFIALGKQATDITTYGTYIPNTILTASFYERLITIPKIIYYYITTFVFPINLVEQSWYVKQLTLGEFFLPLIIVSLILGLFFYYSSYLYRKEKRLAYYLWFFFLWFLLGIFFHLQIIPLDKTVVPRWFYFPIIGLLGMILIALQTINMKEKIKSFLIFCFIVILIIFSIRTIVRNTNWYSDLTLFSHDINYSQSNPNMYYNYGTALVNNGQYQKAIFYLEEAAKLSPNSYQVWHNMGIAYLKLNQLDKAEKYFIKELQLKQYSTPYRSLVYIRLLQEKNKQAKELAQTTLRKWPDDPYLWRMLGIAAYRVKEYSLAEASLKKSFEILPDQTILYYQYQFDKKLPIKMYEL